MIVPGPSVLYIVTRSMDQGRSAGLVSVLGIHTGTIVHVAAAALGLSAILASSAALPGREVRGRRVSDRLGVKALRERHQEASEGVTASGRSAGSTRRAWSWNVLNPKTALFFLAFLPQFVDVGEPVTPQVLVLGLTFILLGRVGRELRARVRAGRADARGAPRPGRPALAPRPHVDRPRGRRGRHRPAAGDRLTPAVGARD